MTETSQYRTAVARSGEVDALRCLAMLGVIALHAHILPLGWIGVWLFYVISGYVVTLSVLERGDEQSGLRGFGAFMRRRAIRILPVYFGYIALGLLVGAALGSRLDAYSLASLVLFFNNQAMIAGEARFGGWPSGHLWTLSVEMQFYLVYGLALCLLPLQRSRALLIALLLLCPVARLTVAEWLAAREVAPLDAAFAVYAGSGLHFDIFAMGALLAMAQFQGLLTRPRARTLAALGFVALALYALTYIGVNHFHRHETGIAMLRNVVSGILIGEHRETLLYSAVGFAMAGLVGLAATRDELARSVLGLAPMQWIGRISYGGYIYHQAALKMATLLLAQAGVITRHGSAGAHLAQFAIGLLITIALAWMSYRWFELPASRLFSGPPRRGPAATAMAGLEAR